MLNGEHPLVTAAESLVGDLAASAGRVEAEGVERATLDRLAEAGLYGIQGPEWAGGSDAPGATYRRVAELLAGADANTWLVWFQHGPVVRMVAASENTELQRLLPDLCAGRARAGVAFSHLRSSSPSITAKDDGDGWRLTGRQPWCTGWGLIDHVLVGAVTDDDQVMLALVPAVAGEAMRPTDELRLSAMNGTHTVALEVDGLEVQPADVAVLAPRADWIAGDAMRATNVQPSAVGIALAALGVLADRAPEPAAALGAELEELRSRAYELSDIPPTADDVEERLRLTAQLLRLGVEITSTLVVSLGGSAMATSQPAQRWAREATFHLVFAQTADLRRAALATATRPSPG
ncbi:MAG: acyl-CoA dehydrogenase family protein [Acidimicrobiales bacterium]